MVDPYEGIEEEPEWLSGHEETLAPAPEEGFSQMQDSDQGDDDREIAILREQFATLNHKCYRIKDLWATAHQMQEHPVENPYEKQTVMHNGIDSMAEGESKMASIKMYNIVNAVFQASRTNADLLDYVAELFPMQRAYYAARKQKNAVDAEIAMLTKLYEEQERANTLAKLEETQALRRKSIAQKGEAKAAKDAAKLATKASGTL
jgi:hypothetical protein